MDGTGSLTCSAGDYANAFVDHFAKVFDAQLVDSVQSIECDCPVESYQFLTAPPTREKIVDAIKTLPDNKAVGVDGVPAELLKAAGDPFVSILEPLLDKVWRHAEPARHLARRQAGRNAQKRIHKKLK